jgi:hypothetical protein
MPIRSVPTQAQRIWESEDSLVCLSENNIKFDLICQAGILKEKKIYGECHEWGHHCP